jgi:hypothetical protein
MVYFQTKNSNLGKFWRALKWKYWYIYGHMEYILTIWYIIWPFGNLVVFWYIFPLFGILYPEKSGNPARVDGANGSA